MDNKPKIVDSLKKRIDTGEKLEKLLNYPEFQLYLDIVKGKQAKYNYALKNPTSIGRVREHKRTDGTIELVKTTENERLAILLDAQIRYHTIQQMIDLVNNFSHDAQIAKAGLNKIMETKTGIKQNG